MWTTASFNDAFRCKLHGAMIRTKDQTNRQGIASHSSSPAQSSTWIKNKSGKNCLKVVHYRYMRRHKNLGLSGFLFYDKDNNNITETVKKALSL